MVERLSDMQETGGSNPPVPIMTLPGWQCFDKLQSGSTGKAASSYDDTCRFKSGLCNLRPI